MVSSASRLPAHARPLLLAWSVAACLFAQAPLPAEPAPAPPIPPTPPPGFEARPPLSASDYEQKAEGGYFTGLPLVSYDSNTGVGFGARGYYYQDGSRSDPLFAYTPYQYRVFLQAFFTTGGMQFHWLDIDTR